MLDLNNQKAIVLLSGGQDSSTCLAWAIQGYEEVIALSVNYNQKHIRELKAAERIAKEAGVKLLQAPLMLPSQLKSITALVQGTDVEEDMGTINADNNLPNSFVPGRNLALILLAGMVAYMEKAGVIVIGANQVDFSHYPDCRKEAINAMQDALNVGMDTSFRIRAPLMDKSKSEIVEFAKAHGALEWMKFTHSCYNGTWPQCGECPACKIRAKGFADAGVIDPLTQCQTDPLEEYLAPIREIEKDVEFLSINVVEKKSKTKKKGEE